MMPLNKSKRLDWVDSFYSFQNRYFEVYLGDITDHDHRRLQLVADAFPERGSVLELGGGGGQTACLFAQHGFDVSMIEIQESSVKHAAALMDRNNVTCSIYNEDFYEIELNEQFDVICYFDSFGIGSDADQIRLLLRVNHWFNE